MRIMAAKKKPVDTWSPADLGFEARQVGLAAACTKVASFEVRRVRPERSCPTTAPMASSSLFTGSSQMRV